MDGRFVVFDVETPNSKNDRISSIAIALVENGRICEKFYSLVDPEEEFSYFNVSLTGISPDMVRGKPRFPELWRQIEPLMNKGLLVAHNAPFDMSVLAKCLRDYEISWCEYADYACTCRMAKKHVKGLENHRLNTLCEHFDIPLVHHDALSDTLGCAGVLMRMLESGAEIADFTKKYDMLRCCACK